MSAESEDQGPWDQEQPSFWMDSRPVPNEMAPEEVSAEMEALRNRISDALLDWLAEQRFHRARWHRFLTELDPGSAHSLVVLDNMLREMNSFRDRFPYGFPPGRLSEAHVLQGRLGLISYEIETLRTYLLCCDEAT